MKPNLKALLIGVGATIGSLCVGCGMFIGGILALPSASGSMAAMILWPILIPVLLGSIALGLCLSHRSYRKAVTHGEPGKLTGSC